WWGLLAGAAGPRAPRPRGERSVRSREPVSVLSLRQGLYAGDEVAARARADLARRGHEAAREAVRADSASGDPGLGPSARAALPVSDEERAARLAAAKALVDRIRDGKVSADAVLAGVRALADDKSPAADAVLLAVFRALPPDRSWREALLVTLDALT